MPVDDVQIAELVKKIAEHMESSGAFPQQRALPSGTRQAIGKELERVSRAEILRARVEEERKLGIRRWQRAMAAPYVASGGTWTLGECAHLIAALSHQPLAAATGTGALAASAVFATRIGLRRVFTKRWSLRFWLAGGAATAWSALAAVAGPEWTPGWLMTGALAASTVGLSARWWRENRIGAPGDDVEQEFEDIDIDTVAEPVSGAKRIQERWDQYLAAKGKAFENSRLTGEKDLPTGWEFELMLDPDKTQNGFDDLLPKRGKIASVMGVSPADVQIESHPTLDHSRATLKVLIDNPLKDGVPYKGPRYDNGYIAVGPWRDGTGWGSVRIADHKATVLNGLVTGDPGAGKSVFLENLGMSALSSGKWLVFYCDGSEDGDSSPILSNYMTVSTKGIKGAWEQIEVVNEYMNGRGLENAALPEDIRGVNPSPERLGVLWIIDEFHRLSKASKEFAKEVEQVVRLGRKKGLAAWAATQGLDLNLDFAGISTLRDILTSRNVVTFYSSSKYAHNLINGPTIAPYTLPSDGGYALLRSAGSKRAAMLRTDYSDDMSPFARAINPPSLERDEIARLTVGEYIEKNRQSAGESLGKARIALEEYKKNRLLGLPMGLKAKLDAAPAGRLPDPLIAKMPRALTSGDLRVVASPAGTKKDALLAELRKRGTATTGELVKALECSPSFVSTTLGRAKERGEVVDLGHGKWGMAAAAEVVA